MCLDLTFFSIQFSESLLGLQRLLIQPIAMGPELIDLLRNRQAHPGTPPVYTWMVGSDSSYPVGPRVLTDCQTCSGVNAVVQESWSGPWICVIPIETWVNGPGALVVVCRPSRAVIMDTKVEHTTTGSEDIGKKCNKSVHVCVWRHDIQFNKQPDSGTKCFLQCVQYGLLDDPSIRLQLRPHWPVRGTSAHRWHSGQDSQLDRVLLLLVLFLLLMGSPLSRVPVQFQAAPTGRPVNKHSLQACITEVTSTRTNVLLLNVLFRHAESA